MSVPTTATPAKAGPAALRTNRDFRLLWVGQALSDFGSGMSYIVLPLVLLAAGYSTALAGVIGTATLLTSMVVRIPAGYLSDRCDPRTLMIASDLVSLVLVASVAGFVAGGRLPIAPALVAVVGSQVAFEVFRPSQNVLVRRIVPKDQLGKAVALNQARAYGAAVAAPSAAGFLFALSPSVPFTVDAATFAVSLGCVACVARSRTTGGRGTGGGEGGFLRRVTAGLRHLVRDPFLRTSSVYFALLNLVFQALVYALILGVGRTSGGASAVGVAMSSAAVTGLAGSLLAPLAQRRLSLPLVLAAGPAVSALCLVTAWRTGSTIAFVAAFAALCLLTPVIGAVLSTVMAKAAPEAIYGRVTTAFGFSTELLQPTGPLLAGLLLAELSMPSVAAVLAAVFGALAAVALFLPAPATY
ncbi:MFS transporter [Streptomyces sp.]|uniref:MFS transporter n=1 Tax=Streptomyces sp. TaxID=1931 RepID=UPI002F41AF64